MQLIARPVVFRSFLVVLAIGGGRVSSAQEPAATPVFTTTEPVAASGETVVCLDIPSGTSRADPGRPQTLYKVTIEANDQRVRLSSRLVLDNAHGWPEAAKPELHGPAPIVSELVSTAPAPRQTFLIWWVPAGELTLTRDDVVPGSALVTVRVDVITSNDAKVTALEQGFSARLSIPVSDYDRLMRYARCARNEPERAAECLEQDTITDDPDRWAPVRGKQTPTGQQLASVKDATTDRLFFLVSRWIGRDPAFEYGGDTRASRSEPLVLFIGTGGANQVVLLDCQGVAGGAGNRRCDDYAKPSALTLERASFFWAAYIEDEQTPWDTSIEVEFSRSARARDFEDFDPRAVVEAQRSSEATRRVRIGWRRFYMRDAPNAVQVAFTRQGAGYGVRQWVRVFEQRSKWWIVPAAAIFLPSIPVTSPITTLESVYRSDALLPSALEIRRAESKRMMFAMLMLEWPQIRSKARDGDFGPRLINNLTPDIALGFADSRTYFTGGSWPVPLWPDHTSITVGTVWQHVTRPRQGFKVGDRLPLGTAYSAVIEERWLPLPPNGEFMKSLRVGLSIELLKTPR